VTEFGLLPWKTVYDNADFGLAMQHAPAAHIKQRVGHFWNWSASQASRSISHQLSAGCSSASDWLRASRSDPPSC